MKFRILTLVDITETGARRNSEDRLAYCQESNFQTVLQTAGLRANIAYAESPSTSRRNVTKLGFDDKYKGQHSVWEFIFSVDTQDAITLDTLDTDFDIIPIITQLTETATMPNALFRTKQDRNIVFSVIS
jgi:hypothetical protein